MRLFDHPLLKKPNFTLQVRYYIPIIREILYGNFLKWKQADIPQWKHERE
jgi:hypothetical protein